MEAVHRNEHGLTVETPHQLHGERGLPGTRRPGDPENAAATGNYEAAGTGDEPGQIWIHDRIVPPPPLVQWYV